MRGARRGLGRLGELDPRNAGGGDRRSLTLGLAALLFAVILALRFATHDPTELVSILFVIPIALLAVELGVVAGLLGAAVATGGVVVWEIAADADLNAVGYAARILAFAGVARSLPRGGLAAFDLNTLLAYRTTFASHHVSEAGGALFAWRGRGSSDAPPGCAAEAVLDAFVAASDERWTRVTTRHRQRHFERERVVALLAAAGLECVAARGVLGDASLAPVADETRHLKVLYIARRAEGGVAQ